MYKDCWIINSMQTNIEIYKYLNIHCPKKDNQKKKEKKKRGTSTDLIQIFSWSVK